MAHRLGQSPLPKRPQPWKAPGQRPQYPCEMTRPMPALAGRPGGHRPATPGNVRVWSIPIPPDRAGGELDTEPDQLAVDPSVAPAGFSRASRTTSSRISAPVAGRPRRPSPPPDDRTGQIETPSATNEPDPSFRHPKAPSRSREHAARNHWARTLSWPVLGNDPRASWRSVEAAGVVGAGC